MTLSPLILSLLFSRHVSFLILTFYLLDNDGSHASADSVGEHGTTLSIKGGWTFRHGKSLLVQLMKHPHNNIFPFHVYFLSRGPEQQRPLLKSIQYYIISYHEAR